MCPQACSAATLPTLTQIIAALKTELTFQHQPDAYLSQINPISTQLYDVLPTTTNVRILNMASMITWAVTQPTPLEIVVTIDGNTIIYSVANPVSLTAYFPAPRPFDNEAAQSNVLNYDEQRFTMPMLEGRSVRVQIRVTWAVTQPTLLIGRVKYARMV
jgi:hypothetical protein